MRIITGSAKGIRLKTLEGEATRPTSERVKEAIFSSLSLKLRDATVLDLFAGSGAFGIEALSRGSKFCYFNDLGKPQYKIISKNISSIGIKNASVSNLDYLKCLECLKQLNKQFDIVFVDPPYAMDVYNQIVDFLIENDMLTSDAILVLESNKELNLHKYEETFGIKVKKYGYSIVSFLRKTLQN
jgi:16S rRNA (guanine(966)-N(2))-methyltransferase RsmD